MLRKRLEMILSLAATGIEESPWAWEADCPVRSRDEAEALLREFREWVKSQ